MSPQRLVKVPSGLGVSTYYQGHIYICTIKIDVQNLVTIWLDYCPWPHHQFQCRHQIELDQSGNSGKFTWTLLASMWCNADFQRQSLKHTRCTLVSNFWSLLVGGK